MPGECIIPYSFTLADTFVSRLLIKFSSTLPILFFQDNTDTMTYNDTHTFYIQYICKYTYMQIKSFINLPATFVIYSDIFYSIACALDQDCNHDLTGDHLQFEKCLD